MVDSTKKGEDSSANAHAPNQSIAQEAFTAYSEGNLRTCKELLERLRKEEEAKLVALQAAFQATQHEQMNNSGQANSGGSNNNNSSSQGGGGGGNGSGNNQNSAGNNNNSNSNSSNGQSGKDAKNLNKNNVQGADKNNHNNNQSNSNSNMQNSANNSAAQNNNNNAADPTANTGLPSSQHHLAANQGLVQIWVQQEHLARVQQNIALVDYYTQKGLHPRKYSHELQKLATFSLGVSLDPAPKCSIATDGSQIILGDWTAPPIHNQDSKKGESRGGNSSYSNNQTSQKSSQVNNNSQQNSGASGSVNACGSEEIFQNSLKSVRLAQISGSQAGSLGQGGGSSLGAPNSGPNSSSYAAQMMGMGLGSSFASGSANISDSGLTDSTALSNSSQIIGLNSAGGNIGGFLGQIENIQAATDGLIFNSVLLFNCAVMSFQTQQFGQCVGYINQILKHFENVESFLQVKTLFLLLQCLYELQQPVPAQPILFLLKVKLQDLKGMIAMKKQIKDQKSGGETFENNLDEQTESGGQSSQKQQKQSKSQENEADKEQVVDKDQQQQVQFSASVMGKSPYMESLDEKVVSQNSFCILVGAYLRKHAVTPKNVNIKEYELLLSTYQALFGVLLNQKQNRPSKESFQQLMQKVDQQKQAVASDDAQFTPKVLQSAVQQNLGLLAHVQAYSEMDRGEEFKAIQAIYLEDRLDETKAQNGNSLGGGSSTDKNQSSQQQTTQNQQAQNSQNSTTQASSQSSSKGQQPAQMAHKSCFSSPKTDEASKNDLTYLKCRQLHPQYFFNNLGVIHLRLKKYRMAAFNFSKALKFLEVSQQVSIQVNSAPANNNQNQNQNSHANSSSNNKGGGGSSSAGGNNQSASTQAAAAQQSALANGAINSQLSQQSLKDSQILSIGDGAPQPFSQLVSSALKTGIPTTQSQQTADSSQTSQQSTSGSTSGNKRTGNNQASKSNQNQNQGAGKNGQSGNNSGGDSSSDQNQQMSPHEFTSNLNSQRAAEILYNMGLALFKDKKYLQAFKNFEKASNQLRGSPKLWYYMGLAVLNYNKEVQQTLHKPAKHTYAQNYGFGPIQMQSKLWASNLKRFQVAPTGDTIDKLQHLINSQESDYLVKLQKTQSDLIKHMQRQSADGQSKAKQKRQEKQFQTSWNSVNAPKGSLSFDSAIMYFQNALVAIQNEISNETRYALLYKFVAKAHINTMQTVFNEMYAKIDLGEHVLSESASASASNVVSNGQNGDNKRNSQASGKNASGNGNHGESNSNSNSNHNARNNRNSSSQNNQQQVEESKTQVEYGEAGFKFETLAFPTSHEDLNKFNEEVKQRVENSYQNVIKNVHLYMCYLFLETGDYRNCIKHGDALLNQFEGKLTKKTRFTTLQYLAEASCMLGYYKSALDTIEEAIKIAESVQHQVPLTVESLSQQLILGEQLSLTVIALMNKSAIQLCSGDLNGAYVTLDQLLELNQHRVITQDDASAKMLPDYLVSLLVYFFTKTRNLQMVRHLTKYKRFVVDVNHLNTIPLAKFASSKNQQSKDTGNFSQTSSSAADFSPRRNTSSPGHSSFIFDTPGGDRGAGNVAGTGAVSSSSASGFGGGKSFSSPPRSSMGIGLASNSQNDHHGNQSQLNANYGNQGVLAGGNQGDSLMMGGANGNGNNERGERASASNGGGTLSHLHQGQVMSSQLGGGLGKTGANQSGLTSNLSKLYVSTIHSFT